MTLPVTFTRILEYWRLNHVNDLVILTPFDVTLVPKVGTAALDRLRLFLAHRGLSLRGDDGPEHWLATLGGPKPDPDHPRVSRQPFTIVRCVNETYPWQFAGLTNREGDPIQVDVEVQPLWSRGMADYTIKGLEHDIQIERKGDDLPASLAQGRDNFEAEIARLDAMCEFAAIIIEHEWSWYCDNPPVHGVSLAAMARTWVGWSIKYPSVRWIWMPSRADAEQMAFALLERFWWHQQRAESKRRHRNLMLGELEQ